MDNPVSQTYAEPNPCRADFERRHRALQDCAVTERGEEFTWRVSFEVGYDHRSFPAACGGGGHGQSGMRVRFELIGPAGATQFLFSLLDFAPGRVDRLGDIPSKENGGVSASAWDLGYHWPTPRYEGQTGRDCEVLPGGKCYYDGSGLRAGPVLAKFLEGGPHAVWAELEKFYRELVEEPVHVG